MLLSRDYVGYMAKEIVKRLVAGKMIEIKDVESVSQKVRQVMADEVTVEDRLNEEVARDPREKFRRDAAHGRLLPGDVQENQEPPRQGKEADPPVGRMPSCD